MSISDSKFIRIFQYLYYKQTKCILKENKSSKYTISGKKRKTRMCLDKILTQTLECFSIARTRSPIRILYCWTYFYQQKIWRWQCVKNWRRKETIDMPTQVNKGKREKRTSYQYKKTMYGCQKKRNMWMTKWRHENQVNAKI